MKVLPLIQQISPSTFLKDYLKASGVKNISKYLKPNKSCYDDPFQYLGMETAIYRLKEGVEKEDKIGILVDSDCDGYLSSAIIYQFITQQLHHNNVQLYFHKAKGHGLRKNIDEDFVPQIIQDKIQLMIVPDAGTANVQESHELKRNGIDMIVLDHHNESYEKSVAIIINPHFGKKLNSALSGTGVTDKFVHAYCIENNIEYPHYEDLVAISIVSDICDMTTMENRAYIHDGIKLLLSEKGNSFLKEFCKKTIDKRKGYTPLGFSWGCVPPVNSLCRGDNQEDKITFFKALVGEAEAKEGIKVAKNAHKIQSNTVKELVEVIKPKLDMSHKVVLGFTSANAKSYIGLVANKFCGETGKPTILLRPKNSTTWSGSVRSPIPIKTKINESGFAHCEGHEEAHGIEVKKAYLKRLLAWFDNLNLNTNPDIHVTACLEPEQVDLELCQICQDNVEMWGASQGNVIVTPTFYLSFPITEENILICGKKNDCVRISKNNVSYWIYNLDGKSVDKFREIGYNQSAIEMIVKLSINEWNDNIYPQGVVESWKLTEQEDNSWEEFF